MLCHTACCCSEAPVCANESSVPFGSAPVHVGATGSETRKNCSLKFGRHFTPTLFEKLAWSAIRILPLICASAASRSRDSQTRLPSGSDGSWRLARWRMSCSEPQANSTSTSSTFGA